MHEPLEILSRKLFRRQAVRLVNMKNLSRTDLMEITEEDIQGEVGP